MKTKLGLSAAEREGRRDRARERMRDGANFMGRFGFRNGGWVIANDFFRRSCEAAKVLGM